MRAGGGPYDVSIPFALKEAGGLREEVGRRSAVVGRTSAPGVVEVGESNCCLETLFE